MNMYTNKCKGFTIVLNDIITSEISARALGVYVYLKSKPTGWDFSTERISSDFKEGRDAIRKALLELENVNLLKRIRHNSSTGFKIEYQLTDEPMTENQSLETRRRKISHWKPDVGFSGDNSNTIDNNTIIVNTNKSKKDNNIPPLSPVGGNGQGNYFSKKTEKKEPPYSADPPLIYPFDTDRFKEKWELWKQFRKELKKPYRGVIGEQMALKKLSKDANGNEDKAIRIIEYSIGQGYQGLFPERGGREKPTAAGIDDELNRLFGEE